MTGWAIVSSNLRRHWPAVAGGTVLMLLAAAVSLAAPLVVREIIDGALVRHDWVGLGRLVTALAGLMLGGSALGLTAEWVFLTTSQRILHAVRRVVFHHVLALPVEYLERVQTGYLTARLGEVSSLGVFFSSGTFRTVVSVVEFAGAAVILFTINPRLTLEVFALLPFYYLAVRHTMGGYRRTSQTLLQSQGVMSGNLQETFQGLAEIKNLGAEDTRARQAVHLSDEVARAGILQGRVGLFGGGTLALVTSLITVGVLYLSGRGIIAGTFTLGGYVAFSAYVGKLLSPFHYVVSFAFGVQPAVAALDRVAEFLGEVTEPERYEVKPGPGSIDQIEFRDVSFAYPSLPDCDVLSGVDCLVTKPDILRIVGANGSGKSTMVKLLLGYYTGYRGDILINGRDLRELNVLALRRRVSIVSQEPFLFEGTVRENLELACGSAGDSPPVVSVGPEQAGGLVSQLIDVLPQGLDSLVGEGGQRLSGGQRQIVALLRAFVRGSDVVILDEATAHLDPRVNNMVREAAQCLFSDRLCIVIAHSRAPLDRAEAELVLRKTANRKRKEALPARPS